MGLDVFSGNKQRQDYKIGFLIFSFYHDIDSVEFIKITLNSFTDPERLSESDFEDKFEEFGDIFQKTTEWAQ